MHTHSQGCGWVAQGDSLVEPFLVLGKLRRKRGECGNGDRVEPRRREKVFTHAVGSPPFSILPVVPRKRPDHIKQRPQTFHYVALKSHNMYLGVRGGESRKVHKGTQVLRLQPGRCTPRCSKTWILLLSCSLFDSRAWLCRTGGRQGHTTSTRTGFGCCALSDSTSASSPLTSFVLGDPFLV